MPVLDLNAIQNAILWIFGGAIALFFVFWLVINAPKIVIKLSGKDGTKNAPLKRRKGTASGVIFGKYGLRLVCSPENQEGHIAVFGGSGLGKTTAVLIPTLRRWHGTSFVIDISGDIRKSVPSKTRLVYNPESPKSRPYNVFATVDAAKTAEEQDELLQNLAHLIMPDSCNDNDTTAFFKTEGRKMLIASLICYYHESLDFVEICAKINGYSFLALLSDIKSLGNPKAYQFVSSFQGTSEQNTAGCKQALDKAIDLFATSQKLKRTLRRPRRSEKAVFPAQLERRSVFVELADASLSVFAPLLGLITAQCLNYLSTRKPGSQPPVLLCLDEFASLGKMEITDALRKLRKKCVRIMVLTQSMADVDLIYGRDERMAMMNNLAFKAVLGCDDSDTQEYFSRLIGERTALRRSISKNAQTTTRGESEYKDRIVPPADLARLGKYLILLAPDGYHKLKKNFAYKRGHLPVRRKTLAKRPRRPST
jgi:type IV secretory pathway TraG/TraD family ATPase VirD4